MPPSGQRRYSQPADGASGAELTANGGRADGDVADAQATPPRSLHVEGDATCGQPISG